MNFGRFERQIALFGKRGQEQIKKVRVGIVGVGGLGSHVVQQLAFLGVGHLVMIDPDELEEHNLNRLVGACWDDPVPGTRKVDIANRLVTSIDPTIRVETVSEKLTTTLAFEKIKQCDCIFGCVDNDGARLVLNELCVAFEITYFDLASDILSDENSLMYGGRVFVNFDDKGCLYCSEEISPAGAAVDLSSPETQKDRRDIYGVSKDHLTATGPSVISINGVVASIGVTEFMVRVTGLRESRRFLQYYADKGIIREREIDLSASANCHYCKSIRGKREGANIERYLQI